MAKLIMTRGLPGSGKSTWARTQGCKVVEKDEIRAELEKSGWVWSQKNESTVKMYQEELITSELKAGRDVIAADTNFGKHEDRLRQLAQKHNSEFEIKDFTDVPIETCLERNKLRPNPIPERVIWGMYNRYVKPEPFDNSNKSVVEWQDGLPTAVICDLDGTLALHVDRGPYEEEKCSRDVVNKPVQQILFAMSKMGHHIIFVSGRKDKVRKLTEDWLADKADFQDVHLLMRASDDNRNDAIVKNEIFDTHIRGKYNVVCVLDDRDRVVKRWRELGLTCLQVAYGNF